MKLSDALEYRKMSKYSLAKETGLSYSTICDLANEKVQIERCNAGTVCKIAKALNMPMETLLLPQKFRWVVDSVKIDFSAGDLIDGMMKKAEEYDVRGNFGEYYGESEQIDVFCKNLVSAGQLTTEQWNLICERYPDPMLYDEWNEVVM